MMVGDHGMPSQYGMGSPYGQIPYSYPQMGGQMQPVMGAQDFESPEMPAPGYGGQMPFMQSPPMQGTPAMGDCGCGGPSMQPAGTVQNAVPTNFVPPTPPIYSAPYMGPANVAQPPYMNPYGMGPAGQNPYGMPGYRDESN
jgi:morphogenetic protein associated with SpoVID